MRYLWVYFAKWYNKKRRLSPSFLEQVVPIFVICGSNHFGAMEWCLTTALGEPERIIGYNTCQVAKYDNYELGSFSEEAKHAWRDAHWEEDLQKAFDAGRRMAE